MVQGEKEGTLGDTVWATDGTDFHVLRVNAPSFLRTAVRPATGDELRPDVKGPQYRVELTLPTDAPVGALTGYVDVVTDHPKQPSVRIPISGFVRPVAFVSPPSGDFGTVSLDKTRKAIFEFKSFATEKIAITGTENTLKGTTLEVKPKEEGRSYTLEVTLPATLALGEHKGALRIRTDSPKVPLIVVPLSITIAKPAATAPPHASR
jgi:hypothetical protein